MNLTAKELMHLEDYLTSENSREKTLTFYVEQIEDQQIKTMLQQMAQKSKGNFQRPTCPLPVLQLLIYDFIL